MFNNYLNILLRFLAYIQIYMFLNFIAKNYNFTITFSIPLDRMLFYLPVASFIKSRLFRMIYTNCTEQLIVMKLFDRLYFRAM